MVEKVGLETTYIYGMVVVTIHIAWKVHSTTNVIRIVVGIVVVPIDAYQNDLTNDVKVPLAKERRNS